MGDTWGASRPVLHRGDHDGAQGMRLRTLVSHVSAREQPVFVTGGPSRTPFTGPGPASWSNPRYALHHAVSWGSLLALGFMPPIEDAAFPDAEPARSTLECYVGAMADLARGHLPFAAQVWGPMTLAAAQTGLESYVAALTETAAAVRHTHQGLEAAMRTASCALGARPLVLWVADPVAALADPAILAHVWLPAMRRLLAQSHAAGVDLVVHVSGPATHVLEPAARLGADGVSITGDTPLDAACVRLPRHVVIFGNLDSMRLLDRDAEWLRFKGATLVEEMRGRPFVVTPGSALPDDVAVDSLAAFVDGARDAFAPEPGGI